MPLPTLMGDSDEEEYFPTAELDELMWSKEPIPNSWENLCIHEIPRLATQPPQPQPSPNQMDMPAAAPHNLIKWKYLSSWN